MMRRGRVRGTGTRYGASLRKIAKKVETSQHSRYFCEFCGKFAIKRVATGIWHCSGCQKTKAGGAYVLKCAPSPIPTQPFPSLCLSPRRWWMQQIASVKQTPHAFLNTET